MLILFEKCIFVRMKCVEKCCDMLYRKIDSYIEDHLRSDSDKILLLDGARQIGKSYIIRTVGQRVYKNYVEINFAEDKEGEKIFENIHKKEDFYLILGMVAGQQLNTYEDTLVFLDEIQEYPQYLTMLKFLREDRRYHFIASGSLLGVTLNVTTSIPVGSVIVKQMFQLDFEEFLIANGVGSDAIASLRDKFEKKESLSSEQHNKMIDLFRRYLLVGGLPDAVNIYLETHNIVKVREVQDSIRAMYAADASKYEKNSQKKLYIRRIYEMIPSQMEKQKKRIIAKEIQGKKGDRYSRYEEEFEYLITSGITHATHAISNPKYPLSESVTKNLLKLYLNDVGLLTGILYGNNVRPVLNDMRSINLGSVYENAVAQELASHGYKLFYYDNRSKGEVDFLIDDHKTISVLPVEVKSGKDYTKHSALDNFMKVPDYHISSALVLNDDREIRVVNNVTYAPVYNVMFLSAKGQDPEDLIF